MNREDERRDIVLHQQLGLGPVYIDTAKRLKYNTLARFALSRLTKRESLSEEMRVLYVAMTRAKELLILTGCVSDWEAKRMKWAFMAGRTETPLPVYYRRECGTYLDWLMPCLARHQDGFVLYGEDMPVCTNDTLYRHSARFSLFVHRAEDTLHTEGGSYTVTDGMAAKIDDNPPVSSFGESGTTASTFIAPGMEAEATPAPIAPYTEATTTPSECFILSNAEETAAAYPFAAVRDLPSKVSITELKRLYAVETTPDSAEWHKNQPPVFEAPAFIKATQGMTAMRMGTVLHTVAEQIDLHEHRTRPEIDALIDGLIARNLLTLEEGAAVDRTKIERFVNSPLADRMRASTALFREVPFVMSLPPRMVYPGREFESTDADGESVLVHGIIDCYFEENGRIVLVDYKSDAFISDPHAWAKTHRVQMGIYKKAVSEATGKSVSETVLYSFTLDYAVPVETLLDSTRPETLN